MGIPTTSARWTPATATPTPAGLVAKTAIGSGLPVRARDHAGPGAAGRLPNAYRADTYQTLSALGAVTRMRAREVVRLDRDGFDLDQSGAQDPQHRRRRFVEPVVGGEA